MCNLLSLQSDDIKSLAVKLRKQNGETKFIGTTGPNVIGSLEHFVFYLKLVKLVFVLEMYLQRG